MGYINKDTLTIDAILTNKGRDYLRKAVIGENLNGEHVITKFALADDEIDYSLWDETVSDTILENLQCVTIGIIPGGATSWDECECADDTREIEDCITYDTYTCSENIISNGDDLWLIEGNIATTGSTQSIEEFMLDFGLEGDPDDFGLGCTVTILAELTRQ